MKEPINHLPPVFVGPNSPVLPQAGEVNWGMSLFGVDLLRSKVGALDKVKVGVVDTGCDRTHPLLSNVKAARDFTGSASGSADRNGHGTHCSGTVGATDPRIGFAPGIEIYHGKGLGDGGSGGNSLLNALEWCVEQGCTILSCSWGGGGQWPDWEVQARRFADAGIWGIYAGGNSGPNTPDADWPGRSQHVINVAALGMDLAPASFSSAGDKLDTSGAGVNIWSTRSGGGFVQMSGTSMATPGVAGLLALFRCGLVNRGMPVPNVYDLRKLLFSRSTDTHAPGDDRRTGPGWASPALLLAALTPDPPPVSG